MNKKVLKYLIIASAVLFSVLLAATSYVASRVILSGKYQITAEGFAETGYGYKVTAKGVFGSETEIYSKNGIVFLEGYYKEIEFEFDSLTSDFPVNIVFAGKTDSLKIDLTSYKLSDSKRVVTFNKNINPRKGFFGKISDIIGFELSGSGVKDVMLLVILLLVITVLFLGLRRIKKSAKLKSQDLLRKVFANISVFVLGSVFWILIILLLAEIALRIVGVIYSEKQANTDIDNTDGKFVVLCIGDSFTYGVGSTKGNDYPAQLQRILQENTEQEVVVINRGRCAQNTAQTIEKLQDDLNSCKPDMVVMLFGMANSWNYYGYQDSDNYWERIRVVKLFRRIAYNIKYKGASSDTEQNVKDYATDFLIKSLEYPGFGDESFYRYYYAGRYFLALRDWQNAFRYLGFALSLNLSDPESFDAIKVCMQEFDNENFKEYNSGEIGTTVVENTLQKLDELIEKYPDKEVFRYLKALYLTQKSYPDVDETALDFRRRQLADRFDYDLVCDVENSFNNCFDSIENFYLRITTDENRNLIGICRAWLYIGDRNFEDAKIILDSIVCPPDSLSTGLYNIAGTIIDASLSEKFNPDNIADENIKTFIKDTYSDMLDQSGSPDDFRLGISKIFSYSVSFYSGKNQMYFLPHKLKRTASIEQSKIFDWIKTDIETAVEMCIKQNYPVICMNYPVIPPPNSEEISFWADSVGNIWKETALKHKLLFVDNDSVFKSEGDKQNLYFEPHATGSEHCSDKGYGLIAENIAKLLIREKIME